MGTDHDIRSPLDAASRDADEIEYLRRQVIDLQRGITVAPSFHDVPTQDHRGGTQVVYDRGTTRDRSVQDPDIVPEQEDGDPVVQDAASILEFLAWGRKKDPNLPAVASPEVDRIETHEHAPDILEDMSSPAVLQLLLPSEHQVRQLVDYHCDALLWYHGSFYAPTFRDQLQVFWGRLRGQFTSRGIDLQWVALLFSVLTGSLTCAPAALAQSWGFRDAERITLSKRWFQAITACLNRANYASNLSIFSCQAIATATIAAHLLGFSSSQSIYLAAAVRVAQSLGLHRLGLEAKGNIIEKEIGRRVWTQLCSQDWFGIPFSESYLINPVYSTSEPPANCHDHDIASLPTSIPTITSYCRFLYDIAAIMPQLQDGLMSCNTSYTRYEQVLKWDARLRTMAINKRPAFLSATPLDPTWPEWVPWGRRALAISSSHKIIMIHRSFLSASFTNPAFAFTRRTCLAASKTIVKEYKAVVKEDGPILWIHQAFAVAAGIILSLDILNGDQNFSGQPEHISMVEDVVVILHSCCNSTIASRGTRLLEALLAQIPKQGVEMHGNKRRRDGILVPRFNMSGFVKVLREQELMRNQEEGTHNSQEPPPTYSSDEPRHVFYNDLPQQDFSIPYPAPGFSEDDGFENLLYLANHDFTGGWS